MGIPPQPVRSRLSPLRWWWVGGAALLVTAVALLVGWWLWPGTAQAPGEYERARVETVRTALTAAGGLAAVLALLLAVRRQRSTEVALDLQDEATADTRHDAVERRVTELYTKAAEQLGSDKAPVRLAGLHALERLAQGNPEHRQTIVDVICAYLRMPYLEPEVPDDPAPDQVLRSQVREQERQVRLTAQRILTAHLRVDRLTGPTEKFWSDIDLDLSGATLVEVNFSDCHLRDAAFNAASFHDDAKFNGTTFRRGWFTHAQFHGDANFVGAEFGEGGWFRAAEFIGETLFRKARFDGDAGFRETRFHGDAWFTGTCFAGSAAFVNARFDQNARFSGATFRADARFDDVSVSGDAWLRQTTFDDSAWFSRAQFGGTASLTAAHFRRRASFAGARFGGAALFTAAEFDGDVLFSGARFGGRAAFRRASFAAAVAVDGVEGATVPSTQGASAPTPVRRSEQSRRDATEPAPPARRGRRRRHR